LHCIIAQGLSIGIIEVGMKLEILAAKPHELSPCLRCQLTLHSSFLGLSIAWEKDNISRLRGKEELK